MTLGGRTACLWLCLLQACTADLASVGAWIEDGVGSDASTRPIADASTKPTADASTQPIADATPEPPKIILEPAGPYIEAERGELTGGFAIGADPTASEGSFLMPPEGSRSDAQPGDARARYLLAIPKTADYILWGRIHGPDENHNRFWFQLDGGTWYLWRLSTGDVWFWDDLHHDTSYSTPLTFTLSEGTHELVIANARDGVRLDRLYFTAEGDEPPGNDTICRPPHRIEVSGQCLRSCGGYGDTTCGVTECEGKQPLEAYDCDVCCLI